MASYCSFCGAADSNTILSLIRISDRIVFDLVGSFFMLCMFSGARPLNYERLPDLREAEPMAMASPSKGNSFDGMLL